ncbi:substrate-binding domain-containing protein [Rhizobium sp.]
MTETLRVLSAGSLRYALPTIMDRFTATSGIDVSIAFGPAGLLRERIESGEAFDLFASANMAHPRALAESGMAEQPACFATNRLCVVAPSAKERRRQVRNAIGMRMISIKLASSTEPPSAKAAAPHAISVYVIAGSLSFVALMMTKSRAGIGSSFLGMAVLLSILAFYGGHGLSRTPHGFSNRPRSAWSRLGRISAILLLGDAECPGGGNAKT